MTKHNGKKSAPPRGSDAEMAGRVDGASLPPDRLRDAGENVEKVDEANERSEITDPPLDEPGTVEKLTGGAGALPHSLEPAAANARAAERVSEMQKKPGNPNDVKREHLREIAKYVGSSKAAQVLSQHFGTDDPDKVGVHNLDLAIDELHKAADAPKEG